MMKAVILSANKSGNFFPFCETRTKSMILCSGNFLLGRLIKQLKALSITQIYIVVNYQKNLIQDYFEYGQKFGVELHSGLANGPSSEERRLARSNCNGMENKMISQGAALNRGVLTQAVIQAYTIHSFYKEAMFLAKKPAHIVSGQKVISKKQIFLMSIKTLFVNQLLCMKCYPE